MLNGKRIVHGLWVPLFLSSWGRQRGHRSRIPGLRLCHSPCAEQQEPAKIQNTIEELLIRQLTTEGARVVSPQDVEKVVKPGESVQTEEQARLLGRRLQAEYVVDG